MAIKGNQRDPVKEQFWRDKVQRHKQSGQTIREFCEREKLKPCSLSWWRRNRNHVLEPENQLTPPNQPRGIYRKWVALSEIIGVRTFR